MLSLAFSFGGKIRTKSAAIKDLRRSKELAGKGRQRSRPKKGLLAVMR